MDSSDICLFFDLYLKKQNYFECDTSKKLKLIDIALNKYLSTQLLIKKSNDELLNDAYCLCKNEESLAYFDNILSCIIICLEGITGYKIEIEFDEKESLDDFSIEKQDILYFCINPKINIYYLTRLLLNTKEEFIQNILEIDQQSKLKQKEY